MEALGENMVILLKIQTKIRRDLWIFGVRPLNMGGLNKKSIWRELSEESAADPYQVALVAPVPPICRTWRLL